MRPNQARLFLCSRPLFCYHAPQRGRIGRHPAQATGRLRKRAIIFNAPHSGVRAATLLVLCLTVHAGPALCGIGQADSPRINVDVRPPDIEILAPLADEIFYGLDQTTLSWTVQETHPGVDGLDREAAVSIRGAIHESITFDADDGLHSWLWDVPDLSSGENILLVTVSDAFGNVATRSSGVFTILPHDTGTGDTPRHTGLGPAHPNPFNPTTRLTYSLAEPGRAVVRIHDLRGRAVRDLADAILPIGDWSIEWDGRDDLGRRLPGGTYLVALRLNGPLADTRKVVLAP